MFSELLDRARRDPFGFATFNRLQENLRWARELFATEHVLATGEHNTPTIPRTLGTVRYNSGYTLEGFNSYASLQSGHNPAAGQLILTLDQPPIADQAIVARAAAASETGSSKPCLVTAYVDPFTASPVYFFCYALSSALGSGTGNTWALEDANFDAAVHSSPVAPGSLASAYGQLARGQGLRTTLWNGLVSEMSALYKAYISGHAADGEHDVREVAKAWARVSWDGAAYAIDRAEGITAVSSPSTGQVQLTLSPTLTTPLQVFPVITESSTNSGIICCPRSARSSSAITLYLYRRTFNLAASPPTAGWNRGDFSFTVSVHGT